MTEIELWEQEISNDRSHYFENMIESVNWLIESAELDTKLLEMGILTEADEEDANTDSNDNVQTTDAKSKEPKKKGEFVKTIKKKIYEAILKIIDICATIYNKIKSFIVGLKRKIADKKTLKMALKAKDSGNLDKLAKRLNKQHLVNADKYIKVFQEGGFIDEFSQAVAPNIFYTEQEKKLVYKLAEQTNNDDVFKNLTRIEKFGARFLDEEELNAYKSQKMEVFVPEFTASNIADTLPEIYESTTKQLDYMNDKIAKFKKDMDNFKAGIEKMEDAEQAKVQTTKLKTAKVLFNVEQNIIKVLTRQANLIDGVMIKLAVKKEEPKEEESKES